MRVSLLRRFRRTMGRGLATLMAVSSLVVCLPRTVEGAAAHCPRGAKNHCDRAAVLTCCDAPEPGNSSLPGSLPLAGSDLVKSVAGVSAGSVPVTPARTEAIGLALFAASGSPPADLVTLHAVFRF